MARKCEICKKGTVRGMTVARRGLAKRLGGVGVKVTGRTKRKVKPNVQKIRVEINGTVRRMKICTRCLRTGLVSKPRRRVLPA